MTYAQAARLREALLDAEAAQRTEIAGGTVAAVLAPLLDRDGEPHLLFTLRHDDLHTHAGQMSFPGGRHEPSDKDLVSTALRETFEEIGLRPDAVTVIGALRPIYTPVSDFAVYPFVGLVEPPPSWTAQLNEVASIIELPVRALAEGHTRSTRTVGHRSFRADTFTVGEHTIWGATGRLVADLLRRWDLLGTRAT